MSVEVLMSCLNMTDVIRLMRESAIESDSVIVNQCDEDSRVESVYNDYHTLIIFNKERGLSKSRNTAIRNAKSDYCVLSDDDEVFDEGYAHAVSKAYEDYPEADVILFQIEGSGKKYRSNPFKVGYLQALHFASWNITFRREAIIKKGILFDEMMGSGTGNGSGEEIRFLYDCLHAGIKIQYVPIKLAKLVKRGESHWFNGFDSRYFRNRGWATARYMGKIGALIYGLYFVIRKTNQYLQYISPFKAYKEIVKGAFEQR